MTGREEATVQLVLPLCTLAVVWRSSVFKDTAGGPAHRCTQQAVAVQHEHACQQPAGSKGGDTSWWTGCFEAQVHVAS